MISNRYKAIALRVGAVATTMAAYAMTAVKAVDPTLADVSGDFAAYVTDILTFAVAVIGAFTAAMLIPMGLKKLIAYVRKLLGWA